MVKPTDQEMIGILKVICNSSQEKGGMSYHTGPHRKAPEQIRMQESDENMSRSLYCGFCGQELARQGK